MMGSGIRKLKIFELFKGTGSVGKIANKLGLDVVSLDFEEK
jgi:adenine-specific DNA methylase